MIQIRVVKPNNSIPSQFFQGGGLYLDVTEEERIRLSRHLEQLSNINKITQDVATPTSLPVTDKNELILDCFRIDKLDGSSDYVEVEVLHNDIVLPYNKLRIIDTIDDLDNPTYEVELYGGGWIDDLSELRLRDLDLGTFKYNRANIVESWANTTSVAYPTIAHYGGWDQNRDGEISMYDVRFWFNIYELIKRAFHQKGWSFSSPFLDNAIGAQLYTYLSGEDWFSYRNKNNEFSTHCNIAEPRLLYGYTEILELDVVDDPVNLYNIEQYPHAYWFPYSQETDPSYLRVRIENMKITLRPVYPRWKPQGQLLVAVMGRDGFVEKKFFPISKFQNSITINTVFDIRDIPSDGITRDNPDGLVQPGLIFANYSIYMGYKDYYGNENYNYFFTIESGDVYFEPNPFRYEVGDEIYLADLIDKKHTALDLLKGPTHLIDGKFHTDFTTREVKLFPAYDIPVLAENIEGFFKVNSTPIDLSEKIIVNSRKVSRKENKQSRYINLKFKNSTDEKIKEKKLKDVHSKSIDLGVGENKTKTIQNPFFEPTIDIMPNVVDISDNENKTITIPALFDNLDGVPSRKIAPRIGYCYGVVEQLDENGNPITFNFHGEKVSQFGFISQSPSVQLRDADGEQVKVIKPVYGDDVNDYYNLCYKRSLTMKFPKFDIEFLIWLDYLTFSSINMRHLAGIHYNGNYLLYRIISINDFQLGGNNITPIKLQLHE